MEGAGYDVGFQFARGKISAAAVILACFGLTTESTEAERAELILIILNVAATIHHIFRCIHSIRRINERLEEHELDTYRRNNKVRSKALQTTALPGK